MSLFADTSIWYAAADKSDIGNSRAKAILSSGGPLVTTDHVPIETGTLIGDRLGRRAAERFWEALRGGARAWRWLAQPTSKLRGKLGPPIGTRISR